MSNNPVIYTDPSGHGQDSGIGDPTCGPSNYYCQTIWDPYIPADTTLGLFTGRGDSMEVGADPEIQMPIYASGNPFMFYQYNVRYLGYKNFYSGLESHPSYDKDTGKSGTVLVAQQKNENDELSNILLCYSAGVEACIMYAEDRLAAGLPVDKMVLMGGSFYTYDHELHLVTWGDDSATSDSTTDGWASRLTTLNQSGVDILMVYDTAEGADEDFDIENPVGRFDKIITNNEHYLSYGGTSTNNNKFIQSRIYYWIYQSYY